MEQPNYYAVIPADVRYDKNLSDKAKLLYGEITALTKKEGFCWATNKYFAELYGTSERTISRILTELVQNGYITTTESVRKETTDGVDKFVKCRQICLGGIDKNVHEEVDKNVAYNNTSINNNIPPIIPPGGDTVKTDQRSVPSQEEKLEHNFGVLWKEYPRRLGRKNAYKHYKGIVRDKKLSNQQMLSAIRKYCKYVEEQKIQEQYVMHGSTFFCSGIYDYIEDEPDD